MEEYAEVRARTPTRVRFPGTPQLRGITVTVRVLGIKMKRTSFNSLKSNRKDIKSPQKRGAEEHKVHNTIHTRGIPVEPHLFLPSNPLPLLKKILSKTMAQRDKFHSTQNPELCVELCISYIFCI